MLPARLILALGAAGAIMDEERKNHIERVRHWLEENVSSFSTPNKVTLSKFTLKKGEFAGSFRVSLDDKEISEQFSFGLGGNGKPQLYLPMFCSPLGAPASYPAVDLTDETKSAIQAALESVLPRMKALGLDRDTGEAVYLTTHTDSDRIISAETYKAAMNALSREDFSVSVKRRTGWSR